MLNILSGSLQLSTNGKSAKEPSTPEKPALRQEQADVKFIEWSKSTYHDSYDVNELSNYILQSDSVSLNGLDIGGGIGVFASTVIERCASKDVKITVVDPGIDASNQRIEDPAVNFILAPFDHFDSEVKYDFIVFRLVLHHLTGDDEASTLSTQRRALEKAKSMLNDGGVIFVVENFYEPMIGTDFTSQLIYTLTSNKSIAHITRRLGANTAGEGVRFRSSKSWIALYKALGLSIIHEQSHPWWGNDMPFWQKLPLLCQHRYQAIQILKT